MITNSDQLLVVVTVPPLLGKSFPMLFSNESILSMGLWGMGSAAGGGGGGGGGFEQDITNKSNSEIKYNDIFAMHFMVFCLKGFIRK